VVKVGEKGPGRQPEEGSPEEEHAKDEVGDKGPLIREAVGEGRETNEEGRLENLCGRNGRGRWMSEEVFDSVGD